MVCTLIMENRVPVYVADFSVRETGSLVRHSLPSATVWRSQCAAYWCQVGVCNTLFLKQYNNHWWSAAGLCILTLSLEMNPQGLEQRVCSCAGHWMCHGVDFVHAKQKHSMAFTYCQSRGVICSKNPYITSYYGQVSSFVFSDDIGSFINTWSVVKGGCFHTGLNNWKGLHLHPKLA